MVELSGSCLDSLAALALHSERVAFQDAQGELTYGQARDQVYRIARALLALGLRPGQVVAYDALLSTQALLLGHAINHIGCGQMKVPTYVPVDVQADLIIEVNATAVVIDPIACGGYLGRLLTATPPPKLLSLGPGVGEDVLELAARESPIPFESAARPDGLSTFALTSGTTGRPKIVARRFDRLTPRRLGRPGLPRAQQPVRLLKCKHVSDHFRRFVEDTLACGGTVVTRADFDPAEMIATIEAQGITHLLAPPHQLRVLVDHPLLMTTDLSSLRWVLCTTARASPRLLRRAVERLGPVVYHTYGQTEAMGISRLSPEDYIPGRWELLATCGRALPGVEITVRDSTGQIIGPGERGELWVRTPYVMAGYLNRPALTAQVLHEGWLRTGDAGSLDREGFLTLFGRITDAIEDGDHQVFFSEIENCVEEQPGVRDCAVFTVPELGQVPALHLAVVADASTCSDEGGLQDAVLRGFGPACVPRSILFVPQIPVGSGNGPDRSLLAQWWSTDYRPGRPRAGG
ncbi:MAG TPA: AMP-binding protein [Pseudonocardiaceae bacterium]|nr:AMP-binding protein [Pseudonocardiaceae bacterium]